MKISDSSMFQAILPDQKQTLFLQACLAEKTKAAESWDRWLSSVPSLSSEFKNNYALKSLAPLLHASLAKKEIEPPAEIATFLRIAYLQEQLRARTFRAQSAEVLGALQNAGLPFLVVKGAVLADLYYKDEALRHCHDLDLFLNSEDLEAAFTVFRRHHINPLSLSRKHQNGSASFQNSSGLVVSVHTKLFSIPHYGSQIPQLWQRAATVSIAGMAVRVPSETDMLLHILGHAASSPRHHLRWVCDCIFFLNHQSPDWNQFLQTSAACNLSLVSFIMLSYLAHSMNAEIPLSVLDKLRNQPDANTLASAESLLQGVRLQSRKSFQLFRFADSWLERLLLLKWIFVPHPMSTKWQYRIRHKWLIPFYYLYRPVRYLIQVAKP